MKLSKREAVLLTILIVLGLSYVFYHFVYEVQQKELAAARAVLDSNQKKLAAINTRQDQELKQLQSLKSMDDELKSIESKVPYIKDVPGVLLEIYYLMVENGLQGNSISFSSLNEGSIYNYFTMSFEVRGEKEDVNEFLNQLENFKRAISLDNVDFAAEAKNTLRTRITAKVYLLKDDQAHKEPSDYGFMEGKYGTFKSLFEMFKNPGK